MTTSIPDWASEERKRKARMDDETWADQIINSDEYMTHEEMDLP